MSRSAFASVSRLTACRASPSLNATTPSIILAYACASGCGSDESPAASFRARATSPRSAKTRAESSRILAALLCSSACSAAATASRRPPLQGADVGQRGQLVRGPVRLQRRQIRRGPLTEPGRGVGEASFVERRGSPSPTRCTRRRASRSRRGSRTSRRRGAAGPAGAARTPPPPSRTGPAPRSRAPPSRRPARHRRTPRRARGSRGRAPASGGLHDLPHLVHRPRPAAKVRGAEREVVAGRRVRRVAGNQIAELLHAALIIAGEEVERARAYSTFALRHAVEVADASVMYRSASCSLSRFRDRSPSRHGRGRIWDPVRHVLRGSRLKAFSNLLRTAPPSPRRTSRTTASDVADSVSIAKRFVESGQSGRPAPAAPPPASFVAAARTWSLVDASSWRWRGPLRSPPGSPRA